MLRVKNAEFMYKSVIFFICLCLPVFVMSQTVQCVGSVVDSQTKQVLAFATVSIIEIKNDFVTDNEGEFILDVLPGICTFEISYLGY